jgi:hypothetical protein
MKTKVGLILLALILCAGTVSGEIFKYVDRDGRVHFTDDYNSIPPEYRQKLGVMEETQSEEEVEQQGAEKKVSSDAGTEAKEMSKQFAVEKEALDKEKAWIDSKGAELLKEKEDLEKEREKITSSRRFRGNRADPKAIRELEKVDKKIKVLNEKVVEHNKQDRAYREKRDAYQKKVKEAEEANKP